MMHYSKCSHFLSRSHSLDGKSMDFFHPQSIHYSPFTGFPIHDSRFTIHSFSVLRILEGNIKQNLVQDENPADHQYGRGNGYIIG